MSGDIILLGRLVDGQATPIQVQVVPCRFSREVQSCTASKLEIDYLRAAPVISSTQLDSTSGEDLCLFCDKQVIRFATWQWDGEWVFSGGLEHFVERHGLLLPEDFRCRISSASGRSIAMTDEEMEVGCAALNVVWSAYRDLAS